MVDSQKPNDTGRDQSTEGGVHHESPEKEEGGRVNEEDQHNKADDNFVLSLAFHFVHSELGAKPR